MDTTKAVPNKLPSMFTSAWAAAEDSEHWVYDSVEGARLGYVCIRRGGDGMLPDIGGAPLLIVLPTL